MKRKYIVSKMYRAVLFQGGCTVILLGLLILTDKENFLYDLMIRIGLIEWAGFALYWYRKMLKPMKELNKAYEAFADGYIVHDIFNQEAGINPEHEAMMQKMSNIIEQKELVELYRSQAEYLALQNQINPHFLYNTLEGIRSEALIGGLPAVGEMAEVLAKFFRYTISNMRTMVSVEDEINNVRHYYQIQKFRFGDKISLKIVFEDDEEDKIKTCRMPKLILQPIVENAIRHGIEPLIGSGLVTIRFEILSKRLVILVSDNGVGMQESELKQLNERMKVIQVEADVAAGQTGGVAMVNVNHRIKLLFGQDYGVRFYSTEMLGTDVEVSLPFQDIRGEANEERGIAY